MKVFIFSSATFFVAALLATTNQAFAFPEMIRHGYTSCNSCHISMNGGGILNDYGRELSSETAAMFKSESFPNENKAFYGALEHSKIKDWVKFGGDVRAVYLYRNDPIAKLGRWTFMQADLESAVIFNNLTLVGVLGLRENAATDSTQVFSRRHYLDYSFSSAIRLRAGKFPMAYGINTPDHVTLTRSTIKMGNNYETYNLEGNYIDEKFQFTGTLVGSRPDDKKTSESGFALQGSVTPTEKIKFGANSFYGANSDGKRWLMGIFGLLGLGSDWAILSEIDLQMKTPEVPKFAYPTQTGIFSTQKVSYEAVSGLWLFVLQEFGKSDFKVPNSAVQNYGVGFQFFPRTHFEFNFAFQKSQMLALSNSYYDYAWLMTHFYF